MQFYNSLTVIIILASIFGYCSVRWLKLPRTIGIMIIALLTSLASVFFATLMPEWFVQTKKLITSIDFYTILMKIMLGFLLFAGSIHIKTSDIRKERTPIMVFSTIGVIISTFVVGTLIFYLLDSYNFSISYIHCLIFGALISPTDPIAVLGVLKSANIAKSLETKIAGESLFNDGVAVVVFAALLEISQTGVQMNFVDISILFLQEAGGGILLGVGLGLLGTYAMKSIDDYSAEVMITLAIVMGGSMVASMIHVSGPLAMVIAGFIIGNKAREEGMSYETEDYIDKFWEMTDEILNAILFLLIGLELLVINFNIFYVWFGVIAIVIVLLARFVSVYIPYLLLKHKVNFAENDLTLLTWGGLRGGVSVALALSLPRENYGNMFVTITYVVVLFSIIVQGLTIGNIAKRLVAKADRKSS